MKNGAYGVGVIVGIVWVLLSLPFMSILWLFGGNKPFSNLINAIDKIVEGEEKIITK